MSETESPSILAQIDERLSALSTAEKALKRPSTISFAERQSLSGKAAKAASELRSHRAESETATEASEPVKAALAEADRVLGLINGAHPGGGTKRSGGASGNVGAAGRRSGGGMNSQQRPPDRIGS